MTSARPFETFDFIAFVFFVTAVLIAGRLKVHSSLRFPLLALVIIAVAMPYRIIGGVSLSGTKPNDRPSRLLPR